MKKKYSIYGIIYLLFFGKLFLCAEICAAPDPFPLYPSIERNVEFWTDIYSKYPTTQGILHDSIDLHIVYDVIELLPSERHGARKENRKRIKNAKKKYKKILENLAKSSSASEPEAKRIAALFGPGANPATFRKAIYRIRCQIGQKDRFREGLIRSGAYLDEIKEIFHSKGLPLRKNNFTFSAYPSLAHLCLAPQIAKPSKSRLDRDSCRICSIGAAKY